MRACAIIFCFLFPYSLSAFEGSELEAFLFDLKTLDYREAKEIALTSPSSELKSRLTLLADVLYHEGQSDRSKYERHPETTGRISSVIDGLIRGYVSLFYDQKKGEAFKDFYASYQAARALKIVSLEQTCLLALLKYYSIEIAQNSNAYRPYLDRYDQLATDRFDKIWSTIYRLIFYSKSLDYVEDQYFQLGITLNSYEGYLSDEDPMMVFVEYEKGLRQEIGKDIRGAKESYAEVIRLAGDTPFLRPHKFFSFIKMMMLEAKEGDFAKAHDYLKGAERSAGSSDTLRSNYFLNLYRSFYFNTKGENDSAFFFLKKAYAQEFQLDFRRNTLEISRLNVEMETQEKEHMNLQLRQDRTILIMASIGLGLLLLASYFAYGIEKAKHKVEIKEREVQAITLAKQLKDQELFGIDSMIAGQEKERQRIANDLHDNLGGMLAALKLHFHNLKFSLPVEQYDEVRKTDGLIDEAYHEVRSIAHLKNAGVYAQDGLIPAIKKFADKASVFNKLSIQVKEHGMDQRLENALEITIFRIVQELITNVIKHAKATEATVNLTQHDDILNVMVEDNGVGFDPHAIEPKSTLGLYSIQRRVESMGGSVAIDPVLERGTTIILDIPIR
jgi:signal transduction histidine kinase